MFGDQDLGTLLFLSVFFTYNLSFILVCSTTMMRAAVRNVGSNRRGSIFTVCQSPIRHLSEPG